MEIVFDNYEQLLAYVTNIELGTTFTEDDFPKKNSVEVLSPRWYDICERMARTLQDKYGDDYILTYEDDGPMVGKYIFHKEE